ncbi:MAG: efflux transporter periplasmic adaptor subunit [Gammaproteobacteria bacterium]|nr:efflux transporter periplasmic adaptor subunit [Gammaproteobacteria bacterium]
MAGILKILLSLVLIATLFGCADEEGDMGDSDASSAKQTSDRDKEPNRRQSKTEKDALKRKFSARPVPVSTAAVERGRLDAYYSSTATLTAVEEAVVVARTQGIVEAIFVEEGILVKKGQALAQLDTRRLSLEVNRTQTNLESLQRAFDRAEQLFKRNMISPDAHDQARFNLEREQATLALQLHDLEEATIRAPIDGVITLRHIKLGNTLTPNTAAFELKRADTVEAVLNIPERELSKLKANQVAKVRIDALERAEFIGYIDRVSPQIDADTGTVRVTVRLENELDLLKPGMFARVEVLFDSHENALLVAREAIIIQRDEQSVFMIKEGLAVIQAVTTGYLMGELIEVVDGLSEGDQVVTRGQSSLREGTSVRIVVN